jgi:oxaloacetate decarboxylase beta subunit
MAIFEHMGIFAMTPGMGVMWLISVTLMYLAIHKKYDFYHYGIEWEVIPPLIFLGLGALTDFAPLLSQPRLIFLGAAAQAGVYITFFIATSVGFTLEEAASIGIIGGADGPTTIFLAAKLAPQLLGACAVAAYSYMALVPIIQPPIMRLLTTENERKIKMKKGRKVGTREKLFFPIAATAVIILLVPASAPLIAMFMLGNLFRESKVVERLTDTAKSSLMNIVTIFLGVSVGATMNAENFLRQEVIFIFFLGLFAFMVSTATGVILAKLMNLFTSDKINPLVGGAGVSAVPMAARVVQKMGMEADKKNHLLMFAMGPNIAGVIGTVIAAGIFLTLLG